MVITTISCRFMKGKKRKRAHTSAAYMSQSTETCGSQVEQACGPVSLINALIHMDAKLAGKLIPEEVIAIANKLCLFDGGGLPPAKFAQLCVHVCSQWVTPLRSTKHVLPAFLHQECSCTSARWS